MIRSTLKRLGGAIIDKVRAPTRGVSPPPAPPEPVDRPADVGALTRVEADAQEVKERVEAGEPVVLLDLRAAGDLALGRLPGARMIPLEDLAARWTELERCDEVVCTCARGDRALEAARMLRARGLFNATAMTGGLHAWIAAGGPMEAP